MFKNDVMRWMVSLMSPQTLAAFIADMDAYQRNADTDHIRELCLKALENNVGPTNAKVMVEKLL